MSFASLVFRCVVREMKALDESIIIRTIILYAVQELIAQHGQDELLEPIPRQRLILARLYFVPPQALWPPG